MSWIVKLGIGVWLAVLVFVLWFLARDTSLPLSGKLGMLGLVLGTPIAFTLFHRFAGQQRPGQKAFEPGPAVQDGLPEDPPVAWINAETWRNRNQSSRYGSLGTHQARLSDGVGKVADDIDPTEVPGGLADSFPTAPIVENGERPPKGDLTFHRELLATTPSVDAFWNPAPWPVCCKRLACLAIVNPNPDELAWWESRAGCLDSASFEPDFGVPWAQALDSIRQKKSWETGKQDGDGVNLFQCTDCGRLYGVYSHT